MTKITIETCSETSIIISNEDHLLLSDLLELVRRAIIGVGYVPVSTTLEFVEDFSTKE